MNKIFFLEIIFLLNRDNNFVITRTFLLDVYLLLKFQNKNREDSHGRTIVTNYNVKHIICNVTYQIQKENG